MGPTQPLPIRALITPHFPDRPNIPVETDRPSPIHRRSWAPPRIPQAPPKRRRFILSPPLFNFRVRRRVGSARFPQHRCFPRRNLGGFTAADSRFAELATSLGGARVLRQDPLECLVQFLCSSNNNIARISKMVNFVSSLGTHLGSVEGFEFHEFPSLEKLSMVSEKQLREAGFGYRAKYLTGTVEALLSKRGGGKDWLLSLRKLELGEVIEALVTLPGVGPKVAACIALFSLDQHNAIAVDTHVWKIATRYLIPELAGARLTPKLCSRVAEAFVSKYGKYAGWAQTLLFVAELPSQKALLSPHFSNGKESKSAKGKGCKAQTVVDASDSE